MRAWSPEIPARGGSGDRAVGGAGWGAPTVRLGDRYHFLLGFRASGGVPLPLPHLGSERAILPAPEPSAQVGRPEAPSPQSQLSPGVEQLPA